VPPDFVIERTLAQMSAAMEPGAAATTLVQSIVRRTAGKGIAGDWGSRAEAIVNDAVFPALARQAEGLKARQAEATHEAGVWRLPDGEAFYRAKLATARFYFARLLPETAGLLVSARAGAACLMTLEADLF
jgi:uncharacterized protein (DUF885 family)